MPNIIEIIKQRWPEALLVVIFQAGLIMLADQMITIATAVENSNGTVDPGTLPGGLGFVLGLGTMVFWLIWQLLYIGFVATAFTDGCTPQEPKELMKIGRLFFWRMMRFQIVFGCAYLLIMLVFSSFLLKMFVTAESIDIMPMWIAPVSSFAAFAILVKPMVLLPAVIIAHDKRVREAFVSLKEFHILGAPALLKLFFVCFGTIFMLSFVQGLTAAGTFGHYVMTGIYAVSAGLLLLVVSLAAIKFVAQRSNFASEKNLTEISIEEENEG